MSFSLFRVVRTVNQTPAKEVIKEFLRFIGCIVSDYPVTGSQEEDSITADTDSAESVVNILLGGAEISGSSGIVIRLDTEPLAEDTINKKDFYSGLIGEIIDRVWTDGSEKEGEAPADAHRAQLHRIKNIFFDRHLFGFFQCKRSFRIINMMEVYGPRFRFAEDQGCIDASEKNPVTRNYIKSMLDVFEKTYHALGRIANPCVYTRYAGVNIARKIHEVCAQTSGLEFSINVPHPKRLLSELDSIYDMDHSYMGTLFLAASVCKSSLSLYVSSSNYYRSLLDMVSNRTDEFYSFVYYEYGRHLERTYHDWDSAIIAYRKAIELDELNYQAGFKAGCYEVQSRGDYGAAICRFQNLRRKILLRYAGPQMNEYSNLSLKVLQYLYKIDSWLLILYREMNRAISADIYLDLARIDAIYYQRNDCVRMVYNSNDPQWKELQRYHRTSAPVRVMLQQVGLDAYWPELGLKYEIEAEAVM